MIKIIFLGDIVGKIGRQAVRRQLPKLKKQYRPDLIVANVENLAHGIGFTQKTLDELKQSGVDFFTSGNHAWKKNGADEILNNPKEQIIRPANYLAKKSGLGYREVDLTNKKSLAKKIGQNKLIVVNFLGRVFIEDKLSCPFKAFEKIIKANKNAVFIVDFHAEATSEKVAFGRYFDGRAVAVMGTHTHIPTADETVFPGGTAYVTDVGMVGYYDSVIGANKQQIIGMFLDKKVGGSHKHDLPETGQCQFNAIYLEIDEKKKTARKIKRLDSIIKI